MSALPSAKISSDSKYLQPNKHQVSEKEWKNNRKGKGEKEKKKSAQEEEARAGSTYTAIEERTCAWVEPCCSSRWFVAACKLVLVLCSHTISFKIRCRKTIFNCTAASSALKYVSGKKLRNYIGGRTFNVKGSTPLLDRSEFVGEYVSTHVKACQPLYR